MLKFVPVSDSEIDFNRKSEEDRATAVLSSSISGNRLQVIFGHIQVSNAQIRFNGVSAWLIKCAHSLPRVSSAPGSLIHKFHIWS